MDERLEKALEFSNYMITLNNQKRLLKEKYYQDLLHYHNGGQFTVSQTLISFCYTLLTCDQDTVVLEDDNGTPIEIDNLKEFQENILNTYFTASNSYLTEYNKIKKNRSTQSLVEL
jgi:hypothetical protein